MRVHTETMNLVTFAAIYSPGRIEVQINELNFPSQQLPAPFVLKGDFNAHQWEWGNSRNDLRGCLIERRNTKILIKIINTGSSSHFSDTATELFHRSSVVTIIQ